MITAVHTLIYSDDPPATRTFLRDVVQWPYVIDPGSSGDDTGSAAWLIFRTGPSELGVHPTSGGQDSTFRTPRHHSITLMCDDLDATIAESASRGAQFATDPVDESFGRIIFMKLPGADDILLYEARHKTAHDLPATPRRTTRRSGDGSSRRRRLARWAGR